MLTISVRKIIDTYAEATRHVDQGLSLTLFSRYRHDPRYQQGADLCREKVLSHCITSGFASWRWKVLKLKAAYPARYKESHMKLSRISAINWNKIRDDKDLECGTG